nr:MAG TPA: hypothetical protein [Caudoviricetes sp.]
MFLIQKQESVSTRRSLMILLATFLCIGAIAKHGVLY